MIEEQLRHGQSHLGSKAERSLDAIGNTRRGIDAYGSITRNNESILTRLSSLVTR